MPVEMFGGNLALAGRGFGQPTGPIDPVLEALYEYVDSGFQFIPRYVQLKQDFRDKSFNKAVQSDYIVNGVTYWRVGERLPDPYRADLNRKYHYDNLGLFYQCNKITSLELNKIVTFSVVNNTISMFSRCSGLTALDVTGLDTSQVTNMIQMFYDCSGLTALDVTGFNTSQVTSMIQMFYGCSGLTALDVTGFDTSKVTDMRGMFYGCSGLTSLDLTGFDTSKVTDMDTMFYGCNNLTTLWARTQADADRFNDRAVTALPATCTAVVKPAGANINAL